MSDWLFKGMEFSSENKCLL